MKSYLFLLPIFLLCTSCSTLGPDYQSAQDKIIEAQSDKEKVAQSYATGTVDALEAIPDSQRTPEIELAEELAKDTQDVVGTPNIGDRIDVKGLLSKDERVRKLARKVLDNKKHQDEKLVKKIDDLEKELNALRSELVKKGVEKEKEDNKNIVSSIWHWAIGSFGLLGGIAFLVFCPTIAIPIFGGILRFVVSMIPQIASLVGVVSSGLVKGLIGAIGNIRQQVNNAPDDKTFTKKEVLGMFKKELDGPYKKHGRTIDEYRRKLKV